MKCPKCETVNSPDSRFCKTCATPLPLDEGQASFTRTLETTTGELARGTIFAGRYEIIEELGAGGMGRVYRVYDKKIEEEIALKLIRPEIAADKKTVERFRNEIKTARKITHKNVCRTHDLQEEGKTLFITMEYVRGEDLKSFLRQSKTLSVGTAVSIARQIAEGLGEAHRLGVVHRDLKPGNIMIDKDGSAKIMDFGIARSLGGGGTTAEGVVIGTPEYMSPEQVEGKPADQRADIYALGVILFEMVTGRIPFEGETAFSIAMKHKGEIPKNPKLLNAQIPDDLGAVILKCLEKDKAKRYQSAADVHSVLEKIEKSVPTAERIVPSKRPLTSREITVKLKLKKVLWPGLTAVLIITFGLVLWLVLGPKKAPPALEKSGAEPINLPTWQSSIVVLPFKNLSPEESQEYFCDGMTDELITKLSKAQKLLVISRNSVFAFKNVQKRTKAIAQELNVKYVLEGSVRKAGQRLVISANLVDADTEGSVWADSYERNLEDILDVQNAVAQSIVNALQLKLTSEEKSKITAIPIANAYAYECYLKARQDIYYYTRESMDRAYKEIQDVLKVAKDNVLLSQKNPCFRT